jgi:hypothetical protein
VVVLPLDMGISLACASYCIENGWAAGAVPRLAAP